ncbi:MAG TPA: TolC family protein [Acidobacteriota bacterium]|nr:TolC family protein [Acidobacteriota bacterium]
MLKTNNRGCNYAKGVLALSLMAGLELPAQQATQPADLTPMQAVEAAMRNYPSVRVSQEQINAAAAGIQLARTAYLPRVDALAQVNRATRNNVFGLLLPQGIIPSISGPVLGTNNFGTVWGSAVGTLISWEPFDFGYRRASIAAATALRTQSEAALERTRFEVAVTTADVYVTLVAAQETVRAAQAAVDRTEVIARTINALVKAQLRPGADASRAEAEMAAARTQLIQAQQAVDVARASLSQFVGLEPTQITTSAPRLLQLPQDHAITPLDTAANPVARQQNAVIDQLKAQLRVLERSYFPRFFLQGSAYARGTGAEVNGDRLGGLNGLAPDTQNYALGFTVTFPLFDRFSIHAREAGQESTIRAETARYQQIATDLKAQWNTAVANLTGARRVAANTPIQVSAARATVEQATARYQSGLGNIDEVAEAQRLLAQSEIDDALARLGVWRGLLAVATAAGDIQPFLAEVSQ